jgi:hypothetical protein
VRIDSDDQGTAMSVSFPIGDAAPSSPDSIHSSARTAAIDAELARARGMLRRFGGRGFGRGRTAVAF